MSLKHETFSEQNNPDKEVHGTSLRRLEDVQCPPTPNIGHPREVHKTLLRRPLSVHLTYQRCLVCEIHRTSSKRPKYISLALMSVLSSEQPMDKRRLKTTRRFQDSK